MPLPTMQLKQTEVVYSEIPPVYSLITLKGRYSPITNPQRQDCSQRNRVTVTSLKLEGYSTAQEQEVQVQVSSTSKALVSHQ